MFNFSQNAFKVLWVRNLPDSEKKNNSTVNLPKRDIFCFWKATELSILVKNTFCLCQMTSSEPNQPRIKTYGHILSIREMQARFLKNKKQFYAYSRPR